MLTAAIGMGVPFPNGLKDLPYLTFIVPAGYVLWMLMFRMNKHKRHGWRRTPRPQPQPASRSSGQPPGRPEAGDHLPVPACPGRASRDRQRAGCLRTAVAIPSPTRNPGPGRASPDRRALTGGR